MNGMEVGGMTSTSHDQYESTATTHERRGAERFAQRANPSPGELDAGGADSARSSCRGACWARGVDELCRLQQSAVSATRTRRYMAGDPVVWLAGGGGPDADHLVLYRVLQGKRIAMLA